MTLEDEGPRVVALQRLIRSSRRGENLLAVVVLGIEPGIDVKPGAHAPMIQEGRLAVGRHRTGIEDAVFVSMRRDAGRLLSRARRQREINLRAPGLHRELAHVSGRRRAKKGHGLLRQRLLGVRCGRQASGAATQSAVNGSSFLIARPSHFSIIIPSARMSLNTTPMAWMIVSF